MAEQNGILCIDKPEGFTSFDVVAKLRGIAGTRRVGHAGTLDPMATGVLPLFFGRATKACDILPRQDKRYLADFRLGVTTDTQDATGRVLCERDPSGVSGADVRKAAARFTGEIMQVPPMYSALRVEGKRLYELARQGVEVERKARPRHHPFGSTSVSVGRGVPHLPDRRALLQGDLHPHAVADIGEALGCGAVMTGLRRTMAAGFTLADCVTIGEAGDLAREGRFAEALLPVGAAFAGLPRRASVKSRPKRFLNGRAPRPGRASPAPGGRAPSRSIWGRRPSSGRRR